MTDNQQRALQGLTHSRKSTLLLKFLENVISEKGRVGKKDFKTTGRERD